MIPQRIANIQFVGMLLFLCIAVPTTRAVAQDGAIAWWPLDETSGSTAFDIVGSNHGTHMGDPTPVTGKINGALMFDGIDDYIEVPDSEALQITEELTIVFWAKRQNLDGVDIILEKGGDWNKNISNYGAALHFIENNMFYFYFEDGWRGTSGVSDFGWHHYAIVATDGDEDPILFIDGNRRAVEYTSVGRPDTDNKAATTIKLSASNSPLHIGAQIDPSFSFTTVYGNAVLDEIEIYAVALSESEIQAIFDAGNAIRVAIDIKPGSDPNSINLGSAGVVPVAILSTALFDATMIDPVSVTLAGARVRLIGRGDRYSCAPEDVNDDGILDMVCHLTTAEFLIDPGQSLALLEAETYDGQPIRGEDSIEIVP